MARGRMLSNTLGSSRKYAALTGSLSEFCAALYPLLIASSDDFGKQEGDAWTIKNRVWPASYRAEEHFQQALEMLAKVGLIQYYCVEQKHYVKIVGFDEHQRGLHKRTRSKYPDPDGTLTPVLDRGRAGTFLSMYQELYKDIQGQPYLASSSTQRTKDLEAAREMCDAYDDDALKALAEFFLRLNAEKNKKAKLLSGKQRTLPMMRTMVGDIAKHLEIEATV